MWWSTLICPRCGAELDVTPEETRCLKCGWKPLKLLTDDQRRQIEESGCPHIGCLPPDRFDCIECDDNARNCNCHDCMGAFCSECNKPLSVSDKCFREGKKPKWAIEWDQRTLEIKYHPVEKLKDVPKEIFSPLDELELGRHGIAG